jgi:glycosyltransferase involved in cell wall biosynthesis
MHDRLPRISIVTTSFNQGRFLERTIRSVIEQDYPNVEYIIIDGGSTDNSVEILRRYEGHISYWASEHDNGPEEALDKGFARATGEVFGLLNSDDLLMRGALRVIGETFTRGGFDLVYGDSLHIDAEDRIIGYAILPDMHPHSLLLYASGGLHGTSTYWSSSLHRSVGRIGSFYPRGGPSDIAWFLRLTGVLGLRYEYLHVPLSLVRVYPGQLTTQLRESRNESYRDLAARARADYIRECGIPRWKLLLGGLLYGSKRRFHRAFVERAGWRYLLHMPKRSTVQRMLGLR